jgi:hypothetical protein
LQRLVVRVLDDRLQISLHDYRRRNAERDNLVNGDQKGLEVALKVELVSNVEGVLGLAVILGFSLDNLEHLTRWL